MIVYIENPIDSTKKLLNLINEFGKIVGYKVNIQKLKAFLYTNNEISETDIRKKNPICHRKMKNKVPRNQPNQGGKRPLLRKLLRKEIKEDTNKWKHVPCSWIGRINIIKMSILPKAIYTFSAIPIDIFNQ